MVADVVSELAKLRDASFDKAATGFTFAAALVEPTFKERLTAVHRRLKVQRLMQSPASLALIASLFRDLEAAAETGISGLWEMEERVEPCSIPAQDRTDLPTRAGKRQASIRRARRRKRRSMA